MTSEKLVRVPFLGNIEKRYWNSVRLFTGLYYKHCLWKENIFGNVSCIGHYCMDMHRQMSRVNFPNCLETLPVLLSHKEKWKCAKKQTSKQHTEFNSSWALKIWTVIADLSLDSVFLFMQTCWDVNERVEYKINSKN